MAGNHLFHSPVCSVTSPWMRRFAAGVILWGLAGGVCHAADWPQWRGPNRDGISTEVPAQLPAKRLLWKQPLAGETHAGVAVAQGFVVVADHAKGADVFRCFRAEDGTPLWSHVYPNQAEMDFGAAPRATPLLYEGTAITQSALGDVRCFELASGKLLWRESLTKTFGAKLAQWGFCASPLVVDGRLILNPGAPAASLVALDPKSGKLLWKTPGKPPSYGSLISAKLGGVLQVVGCDEGSLGGWDPATGKRLWQIQPENSSDYMVGTPLEIGGKVLFATDANYTRLYGFAEGGTVVPKPQAVNEDLGPDTATPVATNGLVLGPSYGLTCLDAANGLKLLWRNEAEEALRGFCTLIAGNGRVLVFTESGMLYLVSAEGGGCRILGRMPLCRKTWSHPALANGRLYIRDDKALYCYDFR